MSNINKQGGILMNKKRIISSIVLVIILISVALVSIFVVSDRVSTPEFHASSLKLLDEKKMTVAKLTGAATAASAAISAIPGDMTSPLANEIMDMASYLLIITGVIFLEKLLLTLTGLIAFKLLIPISCCLGIIFIFWKKEVIRNLAIKLSVFGLLIFIVVPTSVYISSWIENNYKDTIYLSIESAENINVVEEKKEEQKDEGFFKGLLNKAQEVAETVTTGVEESIEKAKQALSNFIDAIAVLIITTCVIPILVIIFFIWIIKIIFGISINLPSRSIIKKRKKEEKSVEKVKEIESEEK